MIIKYRSNRVNVKKLHNFEIDIHSSKKLNENLKEYNCKLLFKSNTILKGSLFFKKIENDEDMVYIAALFLKNAFEPDEDLENFCSRFGISSKSEFYTTVDQYFLNKTNLKKLNEDQYNVIENWFSKQIGGM